MIWILIAALAVLQAFDAWTTTKILKKGGVEMNPILRKGFDTIGFWPTILLVKGLLLGMVIILPVPVWLVAAVVAFYAGVVFWNWRQLCASKS